MSDTFWMPTGCSSPCPQDLGAPREANREVSAGPGEGVTHWTVYLGASRWAELRPVLCGVRDFIERRCRATSYRISQGEQVHGGRGRSGFQVEGAALLKGRSTENFMQLWGLWTYSPLYFRNQIISYI